MSSDGFHTPVRGVVGSRSSIPSFWSYSSLTEAEECPKKWMLNRASYPGVWSHNGYPETPAFAAIMGSVVHSVVEAMVELLMAEGVSSLSDVRVVDALSKRGGISEVIDTAVERELNTLVSNPRAHERLGAYRSYLEKRRTDIRIQSVALLRRSNLDARHQRGAVRSGGVTSDDDKRAALTKGTFSEVSLRSEELRFFGRADLISIDDSGCRISDFKTGESKISHDDQLQLYGLLWSMDRDRNPAGTPAVRLHLIYRNGSRDVAPLNEEELAAARHDLEVRIVQAEKDLAVEMPSARPSPDTCQFCSVRQFCDDYWQARRAWHTGEDLTKKASFQDCEIVIGAKLGPRSWSVVRSEPADIGVLVSSLAETNFDEGDHIRLIGAKVVSDPDTNGTIASVAYASDVFALHTGSN